MTRDELHELIRCSLFDEQEIENIMTAVDTYSSASNNAKPPVIRNAPSFKVGQCVSYGGTTCWVKKYNGTKCLAYPALLG